MVSSYVKHLVYITLGIISVAVIFLIAWISINPLGLSASTAPASKISFTEDYCKQLLSKHDPSVTGMTFEDFAGISANISIGEDGTLRTATLDFAAGTLSGCSLSVSPSAAVSANKYMCRNDMVSYATQETDNYLFIEKDVFSGSAAQGTSVYRYYNPDSRSAYDSDLGDILAEVSGCTAL